MLAALLALALSGPVPPDGARLCRGMMEDAAAVADARPARECAWLRLDLFCATAVGLDSGHAQRALMLAQGCEAEDAAERRTQAAFLALLH
jgi:hypothetical protein